MTPFDLYISGPMSGLPDNNYPAFHEVAARYRAAGFTIFNPAESPAPCPSPSWQDWMRPALIGLAQSRGLLLLPGWRSSKGALMEVDIAAALQIPIFHDTPTTLVTLCQPTTSSALPFCAQLPLPFHGETRNP
jgi:hypothetical protein